jgi:CDP-diglyceride synthetase
LRLFETKTCEVNNIFLPQGYRFSNDWWILQASDTDWQVQVRPAQLHMTLIGLMACMISPVVRLTAGTLDRAFQIKEQGYLVKILGRESGLTDVFYCHGMVGVFVMLYLQ